MLIPTIYTGRQNGWLPSLFSELFDNDSLLNSTTFGTSLPSTSRKTAKATRLRWPLRA